MFFLPDVATTGDLHQSQMPPFAFSHYNYVRFVGLWLETAAPSTDASGVRKDVSALSVEVYELG